MKDSYLDFSGTYKQLTIITGTNFSGKCELLNKAKQSTKIVKYINEDTKVGIEVSEDLKQWFKIIYNIDYIQSKKISYTLKILTIGLNCKEGELLIVKNPETNLHPKAIFNITKFFTFLVNKGVQVLIETNSEHIITGICYGVLMKNINSNDVVFFNKADQNSDFEKINVGNSGKFVDENGNLRRYPSGFFDANTKELYKLL